MYSLASHALSRCILPVFLPTPPQTDAGAHPGGVHPVWRAPGQNLSHVVMVSSLLPALPKDSLQRLGVTNSNFSGKPRPYRAAATPSDSPIDVRSHKSTAALKSSDDASVCRLNTAVPVVLVQPASNSLARTISQAQLGSARDAGRQAIPAKPGASFQRTSSTSSLATVMPVCLSHRPHGP